MNVDLEEIRRLEEVGLATWPAAARTRLDGWELRVTRGVSVRGSTITPLAPSTGPLEQKVAAAEAWFAGHGPPAAFRLTELAGPRLDRLLGLRGYQTSSPGMAMLRRSIRQPQTPGDVHLESQMSAGWFTAFCRLIGREPARETPLEQLLRTVGPDAVYVSTSTGATVTAVGLGVVAGATLGIYNVNTDPGHRRLGLARKVLDAIIDAGVGLGATEAVLHVASNNHAARELYRSAGFDDAYRYWYREPVT